MGNGTKCRKSHCEGHISIGFKYYSIKISSGWKRAMRHYASDHRFIRSCFAR